MLDKKIMQPNTIWVKTLKKLLITIITIISLIIIIINFTFIVKQYIFKEQNPDILGFSFYIILSGSMEPELKIEDVVIVYKYIDIKEQDIITFKSNNVLTTHRVIEIKESDGSKKYITKGDNNNVKDSEEITKEQIVGKVIYTIPKIGYIVLFIQSPYGIIMLIILFLLINIIQQRKQNKEINYKKKLKGKHSK